MTQTPSTDGSLPRIDGTGTSTSSSTSALDAIRVAAQDLHSAISDAAVKHDHESKERLLPIAPKPATIITAIQVMIGAQTGVAKKLLADTVAFLQGSEAQLATSLKTTGLALHTAVRQALADSRGAVQKISELVAITRSSQAPQPNKA